MGQPAVLDFRPIVRPKESLLDLSLETKLIAHLDLSWRVSDENLPFSRQTECSLEKSLGEAILAFDPERGRMMLDVRAMIQNGIDELGEWGFLADLARQAAESDCEFLMVSLR